MISIDLFLAEFQEAVFAQIARPLRSQATLITSQSEFD